MSNVSSERLYEIINHYQLNGEQKTIEYYNIEKETLKRYLRKNRANNFNGGSPKILLLDIETAPMRAYVWALWKQNVDPKTQLINDWFCLTWATKWLFDTKVYSQKLTNGEVLEEDDSRIIRNIWKMLNEADIVIAHNGWRFDIPRLNTRFIINGLNPPMPYQIIDTLSVAKKSFAFSSNKLDMINKSLGIRRKVDTGGFELWDKCINGDENSLKKMERYNRGDVLALEDLYMKLRPWIKSHPNLGIYVEANGSVCPTCGSSNLNWGGSYVTPAGKYKTFRCECGAVGRSRFTELTKDQRKSLVRGVAR